jgi:3-deoxy-D-manno-octulosonic-acid transferase
MLKIYARAMQASAPLLEKLLESRVLRGKEDPARLDERKGLAAIARPEGQLTWVHAASVGEAQSALILINALLQSHKKLHVLVTTGTLTSAAMMAKNLPERAFHQFYPLDHPAWTQRFLDHWKPDLVLWMESELWPNMLLQIKERGIPAALVNARLSARSFRRWRMIRGSASNVLQAFALVLAQTEKDAQHYRALGAPRVVLTDNLKYSAKPLPFDEKELSRLTAMTTGRPLWLYASSHAGEEEMACRVHQILKNTMPDLLTVIVPRHPNRREAIAKSCQSFGLNVRLRGEKHALPQAEDDIYIADTMGELGLFYRLAPVSCIGRSFSDDGGGGHNPIEAAQLNCAILYGPNVQYQQQLYEDFSNAGVAREVNNESDLTETLRSLLSDQKALLEIQFKALKFVQDKALVTERVLREIEPLLDRAMNSERACA